MKRLLAVAALVLCAAGCDRMVLQGRPPVYAAWEEGTTLTYADPADPGGRRLQMRVKQSKEGAGGMTVVRTFTSLTGTSEATFRLKNGLVALTLEGGNELVILPEGFPDKVSQWEERGILNSVVGRARVDLPGLRLPDPDAVGIWVESVPASGRGLRRRTLLVPDLGEVETLNWMDGQWKVVNRLVAQGFTDSPVVEGSK